MYKKGIHLDNRYFLVEVIRKGEDIRIIMYDPSISESYSLEIAWNEALEIMGGKEDYETLVGMFKIKDDEIMLITGKENTPND